MKTKKIQSNFFKHYFILTCVAFFYGNTVIGGTNHKNSSFNGVASVSSIDQRSKVALDKVFKNYEVFRFDAAALNSFAKQNKDEFTIQLTLGQYNVNAKMQLNDVMESDLLIRESHDLGERILPRPEAITYAGKVIGQEESSDVRLSIHDGVFSGLITTKDLQYSIELLNNFEPSATNDLYVVYEPKNINPITTSGPACEMSQVSQYREKIIQENPAVSSSACGKLLLSVAIENSTYIYLNSNSTTVQTKIQTMLNLLNGFYTTASNVNFSLTELFIETTAKNTWGTATYIYTIWDSHKLWAAKNFKKPWNVSSLFCHRDLSGQQGPGVTGLASYNPGPLGNGNKPMVCTSNGINVMEYGITIISDAMNAVNWTHETGHLFDCTHETNAKCIMNGNLTGADATWSFGACTNATNTINNSLSHLTSCILPCTDGAIAAFEGDQTFGCNGSLTVNFKDYSLFTPTSWAWDFGDGGTSTQQNPSHTFSPGVYTVKLTASNSLGSNTATKTSYIKVGSGGLISSTQKVGPASKTLETTGAFGVPSLRAMYFKVSKTLSLKSILIYTDSAGIREFGITDTSLSTMYYDTIINLPKSSTMRMNFSNWVLEPGDYCLVLGMKDANNPGIIQNLWRSATGMTYPYSINGLVSIYNNYYAYVNKQPPVQWYIGYDWEVQEINCTTPVGILEKIKENEDLVILPNPSNGLFTIHLPSQKSENSFFEVYNFLGEKVHAGSILFGNASKATIDLSNRANGVYMVRILSEGRQSVQQIIKE